MYKYMNMNPKGKNIEDCAIRTISTIENISWDKAYRKLSDFAMRLGLMISDVEAIETYLDLHYRPIPIHEETVGEFIENHQTGTYAITMKGHITSLKDSINYDTFDPSDRLIWGAWKID